MMINMAWKIGLKSQARRLIGSAPGCAGVSGGWYDGDGEAPPELVAPPGAHATTRRTTRIRNPIVPNGIRRRRERVTSRTPR